MAYCSSLVAAARVRQQHGHQQTGAAACITATACGIIAGGISACTQQAGGHQQSDCSPPALHFSPEEVNCIASAGNDCKKAKKCLTSGMTPATCTGTSTSCSGTVWQLVQHARRHRRQRGRAALRLRVRRPDVRDQQRQHRLRLRHLLAGGGRDLRRARKYRAAATASSSRPTARASAPRATRRALRRALPRQRPRLHSPLGIDDSATAALRRHRAGHCADGQEARYDCSRGQLGCFPSVQRQARFGCAPATNAIPSTPTPPAPAIKLSFCNDGMMQTVRLRRRRLHHVQSEQRRLLRALAPRAAAAPRPPVLTNRRGDLRRGPAEEAVATSSMRASSVT